MTQIKATFLGLWLIFVLFGTSLACAEECDWSTIKQVGDTFVYTKSCHLEVGKLVKEAQLREEEVAKLNEAIKLKDLAINTADERINKWRETAYSLDDRLSKQEKYNQWTNWGYLGLGIGLTVLGGWAAGQASH